MVRHILRYWITFLLPTFYKKIQARNTHYLNTTDPVIITMNHPNAFTDPIVFTYLQYPMRLYYMARGDAFKPGLASWILEHIGIVPIFRLQDAGKEGLKKNQEAYRRVNRLLEKNNKVIVFAEGLCVQERRLRPLKKGVARMIFGAYEHLGHDRLKIIPVGVNYSRPHKFRSKVFYSVGKPIAVKEYMERYRENHARAMNILLQDLEQEMRQLVLHIPEPSMDDTVHYAEKLVRRDMIVEKKLPATLASEHEVSQQIIDKLSRARLSHPDLYDTFSHGAQEYFSQLKSLRIKDWLLHPANQRPAPALRLAFRSLVIVLLLPVYALGMLVNFPALLLTHLITSSIVKEVEFYSSFAFGVAMVVFLLVYLLLYVVVYHYTDSGFFSFISLLAAGLCGLACLHIHPFVLRTLGLARFVAKPREMALLKEKRAALVSIVNKF